MSQQTAADAEELNPFKIAQEQFDTAVGNAGGVTVSYYE
jgi:hypothetical protein